MPSLARRKAMGMNYRLEETNVASEPLDIGFSGMDRAAIESRSVSEVDCVHGEHNWIRERMVSRVVHGRILLDLDECPVVVIID